MSQTKAQLIQPIGVVTAGGVVVTGVLTASSFDGEVIGSATSIISGSNLNVGIISATNFSGDFTGSATGIKTGADIKVGSFTASSFTGDFTGTATSMMRGTGFEAGAVNATGFVANVTGNVTGNATGLAGSVTSGGNIHVGVMTATSYFGDGSNLTGIAATNFNTQTVSADSAETIIDLADGNCITMNQSADTTVGFASTSTAMDVTIIRKLPSSFTTGGVEFDGSNDYLSIPDNADWDLGNTFTLEAWVNLDVLNGYNIIISQSGSGGNSWYMSVNSNGSCQFYDFDGGEQIDSAASVVTANTWNHIAIVANSGTAQWYVNGTASGSSGSLNVAGNTSNVNIGAQNGGFKVDGEISNLRLVKGTAVYTSNFTPPFYSLKNITNTKLLCCQSSSSATASAVTPDTISATGSPTAASTTVERSDPIDNAVTITWPDSVKWNGGSAPTLISNSRDNDRQQFQFITRDAGLTWYAWEPYKLDEENGLLFTAGKNEYGALGLNAPESSNKSSPTQIGTNVSWSKIVGGGQGNYYGMGLKEDGTLWGWGRNNYGQLGQNSVGGGGGPSNHGFSSPVQIPGTWSGGQFAGGAGVIVTKTDGTLWQWGGGVSGKNDEVSYSSPIQIGTDTDWSNNDGAVGGAGNNRLVIKTDGTIWTWGYNEYGELGLNEAGPSGPGTWRSSPTQIGTDATWASAAPSGMHDNAAIKTDGTLWTWGRNHQGQLGQGNQTQYSSPRQVGTNTTWSRVVSSAYNCMMAVKTDNTLWMWGLNSSGMLGLNNQTSYSSPKQIPGEWVAGNNKFDNAVYSTIALKGDGTMWSWGANPKGELGQNNRTSYSSPIQVGTGTNWDTVSANMDFWCAVEKTN